MICIGIGEYAISDNPQDFIITHALGSCVALIIHCPRTKNTAMAHIVLPKQKEDSYGDSLKGSYYADCIVPKLIDYFIFEKGCKHSELKYYLVGGASSLNGNDVFNIGRKNIEMVCRLLKDKHVEKCKMEVGGNVSRTVSVDISNGCVTIMQQKMIV